MERAIQDLIVDNPARPVFRCVLAHLQARIGRLRESKLALDELVGDGVKAVPFDQEWLYSMSLLAETTVLVGDPASAAVLYSLLVPWEAFNAADLAEGVRGSIARSLGDLAVMLERPDEARHHFEAALAMNDRMGARPWLAQTQEAYARLLLDRDRTRARALLDQALATYRELGMKAYEARAAAVLPDR
jgi:tetratricopeptide (TPR) repeat protein